MPLVTAGDVELEYFEAGSGDRVAVLVHGASSSARIWESVQRDLAEAGIHTYAISLVGAGGSTHPTDLARYAPASTAQDLARALDALELTRFTLVGHSLGTLVARYYLRDHPDRVAALVLMAGPDPARPALPEAERAQRAARSGAAAPAEPTAEWHGLHEGLAPETRTALWQDIRKNPSQRAAGQQSPWPGLEGEASRIDVPTLVVLGDADAVVPPEVAVRGYLELPSERRHLHVFHGIGHYPNAQVPAAVARVYRRFMDEHAS